MLQAWIETWLRGRDVRSIKSGQCPLAASSLGSDCSGLKSYLVALGGRRGLAGFRCGISKFSDVKRPRRCPNSWVKNATCTLSDLHGTLFLYLGDPPGALAPPAGLGTSLL